MFEFLYLGKLKINFIMKKSLSIFLAASIMWVMTLQTSCIGSFNLTKAYWDWNSGLDKWLGGVFFLFLGGFITGITFLVDVVILNLIEFWSGSNPMSMNVDDMEQQIVMGQDGNTYEVTATMNRFDIVQLTGENAGVVQAMIYNPNEKSWSQEKGCEVIKLAQLSTSGQFISIYAEDGRVATIPTNISDKALAAKMVKNQMDSQTCMN